MDGGYINEVETVLSDDEGGQLKTKNGRKYIIKPRDPGFYVTKTHVVLFSILVAIVIAAVALLTYFLLAHRCSNIEHSITSDGNADNIEAAGFIVDSRTPRKLSTPNQTVNDSSSRALKFNEGWSPTFYTLIIQPHITNGSTNGHVIIDITKDANAKDWPPIVLDINNITITKAQVYQSNETVATPLDINTAYGENNDTFIITFNKPAEVTNKTLQVNLKFLSQLSSTLQGFYRTNYDDIGSDTKKWLASTQFSPIDARRAFPCFDRPDKKAQFKISLIYDEKRSMALSNMPSIHTSSTHPGFIRQDFDVTPKMSTYLVAFMVTDLIKANSTSNIQGVNHMPEVNIWTRNETSDMTHFGFDLTTNILPFYENYFGITFKLPKIDLVAVPDFGFSAMENWGLITFRESALLVPENEDSQSSAKHSEHVASIIAHELAHQWFGNLVTMKYWDDLWLKEGFATYMSYVALDKIKPTWRYMKFFGVNELQAAMNEDSNIKSHPISFPVSKPTDIRRIFDPISYSKGASIIRMMDSFLGKETFNGALQEYLHTFEYSNAMRDDLWSIMTKYGHSANTLPKDLNVKQIMDTWTLHAGYPVIQVTRNGSDLKISQKRYLLPKFDKTSNQKWFIPITFVSQANTSNVTTMLDQQYHHYWLNDTSDSITLSNSIKPEHWYFFNIQRAGYYRVNYDLDSWAQLIMNYDLVPEENLAQLLDDSFNLARAEITTYDVPLTLFSKLRASDYLPWAAVTPALEYLNNMLIREPAYEHFRALVRHIIKPIYSELGFDEKKNETHVELMHRMRVIQHACFYNNIYCTNRAQLLFRDWMSEKTKNLINPNLKELIYCTALREGSYEEWYFAYNRYLDTSSASEKELILTALGCTTKPWLLAKYLNMTITPTSGIRKQDGARAFIAVAENSLGFELAFEFLMTNIKEISEYYGDGFSTLAKMVDSITTFMNKEYHLEQLNRFVKKAQEYGLKSAEGSIQIAIEKVKNNIHWRSKSYYQLKSYLEQLVQEFRINMN